MVSSSAVYDPGAYPPFAVTVDVALFTIRRASLHVLLIRAGRGAFQRGVGVARGIRKDRRRPAPSGCERVGRGDCGAEWAFAPRATCELRFAGSRPKDARCHGRLLGHLFRGARCEGRWRCCCRRIETGSRCRARDHSFGLRSCRHRQGCSGACAIQVGLHGFGRAILQTTFHYLGTARRL